MHLEKSNSVGWKELLQSENTQMYCLEKVETFIFQLDVLFEAKPFLLSSQFYWLP